jgi:hypothetical protein
MKKLMLFAILSMFSALSGCTAFNSIANPTAESLGNDVAGMLGVRPGQVKVTDIETTEYKTYFVATTYNGSYNCAVDSGKLVALASKHIVRTCTPIEKKHTTKQKKEVKK